MKRIISWLKIMIPVLVIITFIVLLASILSVPPPALAQGTRIIFLHHSCGENLIEQGNVREGLSQLGYEFYDHGYNDDGLRLADGSYSGTNYDVPGDNTDPDGLAEIFNQPLNDPPDNTFSYLMQYDVIAFKSCYPTSNIESDEQLGEYQAYYRAIRDRMDQHPEKTFIIVTQPPEVPGNSDQDAASRARSFVNWLGSEEYLSGHANIFVFDFFNLLAGEDNFLRADYRFDDYDGHPNERANREIGPIFVEFIGQVIQGHEPGEPIAPSQPTAVLDQPEPSSEQPAQPAAESALQDADALIDDFEVESGPWDISIDDLGSTMRCENDSTTYHTGSSSLLMRYSLVGGGYAGCGRAFETPQDWSTSAGVSLWLSSDRSGEDVTFGLFSGDPNEPTPFEVRLTINDENWSVYSLPWDNFEKADWFGEAGLAELDATRITGFGFSLDSSEALENSIWVDDIVLSVSAEELYVEPVLSDSPAGDELAADESEQIEAPQPEESEGEEGGRICPFSTLAVPLAAMFVYLAMRKKKDG